MGEEGHGSVQKSVELLGIGAGHLRRIESDREHRLRPDVLEEAIRVDREAGLQPCAVVASAGTVNTGAIDPLAAIAAVVRRHGLWLHVDGAYGAPAILTERFRAELSAISLADSIAVDPHKWLSIPVEAAIVLIRDAAASRSAFSLVPPYLQTAGDDAGVAGPPWFAEFGFSQTRAFHALKVWMAIKHHGLGGYRATIERDIELADTLASLVEADPDLELLAAGLSIVCFRLRPKHGFANSLDEHNRLVLDRLQLGGKVFVSGTQVDGVFALRACFVNHRTRRTDLDVLLQAAKDASDDIRRATA